MRHTHNGAGSSHRAPRRAPRRNPVRLAIVAAVAAAVFGGPYVQAHTVQECPFGTTAHAVAGHVACQDMTGGNR